jgi:putative PLP-dependent aminotransferase (TIGR04422 family)
MTNSDYQWPQANKLISQYYSTNDWNSIKSIYADIEAQLTEIFGFRSLLLPSARAGISSILEFSRASRDHVIFAPKYTSYCVWDLICRFSNPTIKFSNEVNFAITVNKWGYVSQLSKSPDIVLIEDSVDSLVTESSALFPLGGDFEIFSLPKLIASQSGGVVLSKNENYINWIKETRFQDKELILRQSLLKYKKIKGELAKHESPEILESKNRSLDLYGLENIISALPNLKINQAKIKERLEIMTTFKRFEKPKFNYLRLPCVFPLNQRFFDIKKPELFMQRYFDFNQSLNSPDFLKCWIMPLHFGINDFIFQKMLSEIITK